MKGLLVTIVDVLGIFVPGFLLLIGILIFPPLANDLFKQLPTWSVIFEAIRDNLAVLAILSAIISYVLGFILRLCSIRTLQLLTLMWWAENLGTRAKELEKALKLALNDPALCETIELDSTQRHKYESAYPAPYFPFAKRIVRSGNPVLWADAERMEAEIRFAAGIFIPLLVFILDGVWLNSFPGYVLTAISSIGATVILLTFPTRRIREVIYIYYLALIVLRYPSVSSVSDKSEMTE